MIKRLFYVMILFVLCLSCKSDYMPKPKGYNRIVLPANEFVALPDTFPYQFELSRHAKILKDSSWIAEPYWIDLYYPDFEASIQISYKVIDHNEELLKEYLATAYKLTSKHQVKAYAIDEAIMRTQQGKTGSRARIPYPAHRR